MKHQGLTPRNLISLLAASSLSFTLLMATSPDADARHKRPGQHSSIAGKVQFENGYKPPKNFTCLYVDTRNGNLVDDYECTGSNRTFLFGDKLVEGGDKSGEGWDGIAAPDSLSCHRKAGKPADFQQSYKCSYQHKHDNKGKHTHKFSLDRMVSAWRSETDSTAAWFAPHQ